MKFTVHFDDSSYMDLNLSDFSIDDLKELMERKQILTILVSNGDMLLDFSKVKFIKIKKDEAS